MIPRKRYWHRWAVEAPIDEFKRLYNQGLSSRQIAAQTGWSKSYVALLCKNITRTQSEAAILRQPARSTHWRSSRQAARKVVERSIGRKLESNEHVHHINKDYTDNRIENLEVLSASEHAKLHNPKNPIPRHLRPARQAWVKQWNAAHRYVKAICAVCEKEFEQDKYAKHLTCSGSCGTTLSWVKRRAA